MLKVGKIASTNVSAYLPLGPLDFPQAATCLFAWDFSPPTEVFPFTHPVGLAWGSPLWRGLAFTLGRLATRSDDRRATCRGQGEERDKNHHPERGDLFSEWTPAVLKGTCLIVHARTCAGGPRLPKVGCESSACGSDQVGLALPTLCGLFGLACLPGRW